LGSSIRFLAGLLDFFIFGCTGGESMHGPELELEIVNSGEGENSCTDYILYQLLSLLHKAAISL
jgi:hypothetical protein